MKLPLEVHLTKQRFCNEMLKNPMILKAHPALFAVNSLKTTLETKALSSLIVIFEF